MGKMTPNGGKIPNRAKREPGTGGSTPAKNTMGNGGGSVPTKNVMGHGERCASASGHLMGKGC